MIKLLPIIMLILLGCNTERQFTRQLVKGSVAHRGTLAEYCSSLFPVKSTSTTEIEYLPGKDIQVFDTVTVGCDTIDSIVKVPVIRKVLRVDTMRIKITDTVENTARVEALSARLADVNIAKAVCGAEKDRLAKANLRLVMLTAAMAVLVLIMTFLFIRK